MFAEGVKLLPPDSFRDLLQQHADKPDVAMRMLAELWHDMDGGGFSAAIASDVLRFNGKLFKQPDIRAFRRRRHHVLQVDDHAQRFQCETDVVDGGHAAVLAAESVAVARNSRSASHSTQMGSDSKL